MNMNQAMQAVERIMSDTVNSKVTTLRDASHHILEAGGKRFRPRVVLLAYEAMGGTDVEYIAPVAAAIELVHTASVVHDDINDHGFVRRGRPSINAIWGRTFALLTGDFLFTKVYELMAPYGNSNITLAQATVALVEVETLQAAAAKEGNLSREVYMDIIALKTAALFRAAAHLGGELAGATREQIDALANYGYNIGLAFQIIDDILDLIGDTSTLGKTAGIDMVQGKGVATAYASHSSAGNGGVAVAAEEQKADPLASIKSKVLRGDTIEQARLQSQMLVEQAIDHISILPPSPARDQLITLARSAVERDH